MLFSADDRTGALEIGGLAACVDREVPVGLRAEDPLCCVRDIASRHLTTEAAQSRMEDLLSIPAEVRSHKMDAGLRGNWAHEVDVLLRAGFKVAIVCSFPDAGRRCLDGVVYIHDKPVLESVFAEDPRTRPVSSRPAEVLEQAGVSGDVVVWDANDNAQMSQAVARARSEKRILVGASGALGELAVQILGKGAAPELTVGTPCLVLCGSLNPRSREQLALLTPAPQFPEDAALSSDGVTVVASPELADGAQGEISAHAAAAMSQKLAECAQRLWSEISGLVIVGGDTVAAVIGEETMYVRGNLLPGIPLSKVKGIDVVTKGGGIGAPDTLLELVPDRILTR